MYRRDIILGMTVLLGLIGTLAVVALTLTSSDFGGVSGHCVAIVDVTGAIIDPDPTVDRITQLTKDDDVLGIVLRLNTPGGGISATQEIYYAVVKARLKGKIIVASMGSVAASGGYYIAAACDSIVATPGTITGSIGVIANFTEFSRLFDKLGITFNVRKTGKYKDTGSIARKMTDEEAALIDGVIMDSYNQFVEAVSEGRNLDPDYVRQYADGRVFTGRQALELGFVDILGTYQDAIDLAGDMTGLGIDPPVREDIHTTFWDIVMGGVTHAVRGGLEQAVPNISYMWLR